jgi:prepilin-type N-terminal cleavage/methylation domain-containing protein
MTGKRYKNVVLNGLTMMEMIISLAIIAVIFAVTLPQFRNMENSWASKRATAEAIQNGRILVEHLSRDLARAVKITAVSNPADTIGYIEFEGNDTITYRYEIGADNIVEFGQVGTLSDLAGPVSQLQFTCYDAQDLDTPITTPEDIRCVKVQTTLTNAGPGQDQTYTAAAYLRSNPVNGISKNPPYEYDSLRAKTPALAQIDSTHYLCVYTSQDDDGWAVVLTVDTGDWTISRGAAFEFDPDHGETPALVKVDATHFLCAYHGRSSKGLTCILTIDTGDWTISRGPEFEYRINHGLGMALAKVDDTHYLCAYSGASLDGWTVILVVNPVDWSIAKETDFEYDSTEGTNPTLAQIDAKNFLCTYTGPDKDGWASILKINTSNWTITEHSELEFDTKKGLTQALAKIDGNHFLCAYRGQNNYGYAVVLETSGSLSAGTKFVYDSTGHTSDQALALVGTDGFLCAYKGRVDSLEDDGWSTDLRVDTGDWTVTNGPFFEWDDVDAANPALAQIDAKHHLCVYEGTGNDGWAVVIEADVLIRP